jgi:hypothetical protein
MTNLKYTDSVLNKVLQKSKIKITTEIDLQYQELM